jgi:hypothetical protein
MSEPGSFLRKPGVIGLGALLALACGTKTVTTVIGVRPDSGMTAPRDGGFVYPPGSIDPLRPPVPCPSMAPSPRKAAGEACACDVECATGTCQGGICCAGVACATRKPAGLACESADQCQSGFCTDGVCCNVACTGACVSCNQPEQMGECAPVPAGGEDLHNVCRKDSPESCGQSGYCNGRGGCARFAAGTICQLSSCDGKEKFVPASLCDGEGVCVKGVALSCAPSTCEGGSCLNSCTGHGQCMAPNTCVNGSCGPKGLGQDCTSGAQCESGNCVDGVCCESACTGKCTFCASPEARGKCVPVRADVVDQRAARGVTDPARICVAEPASTCGTDGRCDGRGACQIYRNGTVCGPPRCDGAANTQRAASVCMGGSCRAPSARSCAPYQGCSGNACRGSCASDAQCSTGNVCTASDCGKKPDGASCTTGNECMSEVCAQGRCCAGACDGICESCAVPGQEGVCTNVPVGGADPTGSCRDDACSNGCDGNGGCRREPGDGVVTCGAASCTGNSSVTRTCDANGVCQTGSTPCGEGFTCMAGSCFANPKDNGEPCVSDAQCASNRCIDNVCCATACSGACRQCQAGTGLCGNRTGRCGNDGSCMDGVCCEEGLTLCPGACRNLDIDRNNCGSCGTVCPSGRICSAGRCVCDGGTIECGNTCVDPRSSVDHCGGCGNACPQGAGCDSGTCAACPADRPFNCNGVCRACCAACTECQRCSDNGQSCLPARDSLSCGTDRVCCTGMCCGAGLVCRDGCSAACDPVACAALGPCRECKGDGTCGNKAQNTSCSDGNACTTRDQCDATGTCAGTPQTCDSPPNTQCFDPSGTCDGGACTYTPRAPGTDCNDGDSCTTNDACSAAGVCQGVAVSCNTPPNMQCFNDAGTCSGGNCTYTPKRAGAGCNDGDSCTANDECDGDGLCVGAAVVCNSPGVCETTMGARCVDGGCVYAPATGQECNDGQACTTEDRCSESKQCRGTPMACAGEQTCQADGQCGCGSGMKSCPGNRCIDVDACCASCDDADPCTADACAAGTCENSPIPGCGVSGADAGS